MAYGSRMSRKRFRKKFSKRSARFRKFRRRRAKGFSKKLLKAARTPGINSVAEKAVAIIAKKQAEKLMSPNLIMRTYLWTDYRMDTNQMNWANTTPVGWEGLCVPLMQIPKLDNHTNPVPGANPQQPQPEMRPQPAPVYGNNVIAPTDPANGFRRGLVVRLRNVSLALRLRNFPLLQNRLPDGSIQNLAQYEHAFVKWSVVATERSSNDLLNWEPDPQEVLPMKKFGFSPRLDTNEVVKVTDHKFKTLMRGTIKCNYSQYNVVETCKEYFRDGLNIKVDYESDDIYGQKLNDSRYNVFLVVRSNIPSVGPFLQFRPNIAACVKIGYRDE